MSLDISTIFFGLFAIVAAISLHEMMHAFAGYYLGDDTAKMMGRITINPLAHIDIFTTVLLPLLLLISGFPPIGAAKPVPFNPARVKWEEFGVAIIAAAGPLTNFVLAAIGAFAFSNATNVLAQEGLAIFTVVNVGFFVFNLIPLPPLDGSRVLYAFAPDFVRDFMSTIERMGLIVIIFFLVFALPAIRPLLIWANEQVFNVIL